MEQPLEDIKLNKQELKLINSENGDIVGDDNKIDSTNDNDQPNAMSSYINQWNSYFESNENNGQLLNKLKTKAFTESLRSCHFRSICWRIFLGCLPENVPEWKSTISESRSEYSSIKEKHVTNPHETAEGRDLQTENPLSQSDNSSWSQYFKNNELKTMIERDVRRTCPEMDFFHADKIRNMLGDILFCYAREHESLSYRQGMHELLAPLIFVLHCDVQGAAHAKEIGQLPDLICTVLDEDYLEHDAYKMFSQVMTATNAWYSVSGVRFHNSSADDVTEKPFVPDEPFQAAENQMQGSPLAITNKLNHIHDKLLADFDVELYHHLNRLEIIPQVYGLRWVRLLFGREFDLQDLLVLWDALFADSHTLDLVDYIFVAMMSNIRYELLNGEYCTCMQLLMKYPPIEDIYDFVHLAMYYRDPENNSRPAQRSKPPLATTKSQPPTHAGSKKNKILSGFKIDNPFSNISRSFKKGFRTIPTQTRKSDLSVTNDSIQNLSPRNSKSDVSENIPAGRMRSMSGLDTYTIKKREDVSPLDDIACLKRQLTELQEKCQFCSDKLDASIRLLQPHLLAKSSRANSFNEAVPGDTKPSNEVASQTVLENEEPLVALANLKQVRDMLRGILSFSESSRHSSIHIPSVDQQVDGLPSPPSHLPGNQDASSPNQPEVFPESWTVVNSSSGDIVK